MPILQKIFRRWRRAALLRLGNQAGVLELHAFSGKVSACGIRSLPDIFGEWFTANNLRLADERAFEFLWTDAALEGQYLGVVHADGALLIPLWQEAAR